MKFLEKEIVDFHLQQSKIEIEKVILSELEKVIIEKYCPFKKGDKVIFNEWFRGNNKDYYGIIKDIYFNVISDESVDSLWVICVEVTTKDFSKSKGGYNSSYKYLGKNKKDVIRKA